MTVRSRAFVAGAFALFIAWASAGEARAPTWIRQTDKGRPVASIGMGPGGAVLVTCTTSPAPAYTLVVRGPARGLKAGRGVKVKVDGRRKVTVRFNRVEPGQGGTVILTTSGGSRGSIGDQSGALWAIEAIATAKKPITVSSGAFSVTAPATGVAAAMQPLIARCGDLRKMARRAEGREGSLN